MENPNSKENDKFIERTQDEIDVKIGINTMSSDDKQQKDTPEKKKNIIRFWKRKKVTKILYGTFQFAGILMIIF